MRLCCGQRSRYLIEMSIDFDTLKIEQNGARNSISHQVSAEFNLQKTTPLFMQATDSYRFFSLSCVFKLKHRQKTCLCREDISKAILKIFPGFFQQKTPKKSRFFDDVFC